MTGENARDDDFLVEVVKRAPLLAALRDRPRSMAELNELLSMSRSTVHRAAGNLESMGLLEKADGEYSLTDFGDRIAEETRAYRTRLATARRLEPFIELVEPRDITVPLDRFVDAEVIRPQPRQAHNGVKRIVDLIRGTDSLRMFSSIISPFYVEVAHGEMHAGTEIEVVFDERVVEIITDKYYTEAIESLETGNFTVHVGEGIPFELFLTDDRIAMAAHDEFGHPRIFVETDAQDAVRWGEDLFRDHVERAWQFDPTQISAAPEPNRR